MPEEKIQFTAQSEPPELEGEPAAPEPAEDLVKSLEETGGKGEKMSNKVLIFLSILVVFLGMSTGFLLARRKGVSIQRTVGEGGVKKGMVVGMLDAKTFRDSAEGTLEEGGINGEGSHHLVRTGGESQNVYLTSSVIDLDQFAGHKVKVWGETFAAQKAGWLMDVGKLEVLE